MRFPLGFFCFAVLLAGGCGQGQGDLSDMGTSGKNTVSPDMEGGSSVCTDTEADPMHCGDCDTRCALPHVVTQTCANGQCVVEIGTCEAGWADCDGIATDGCETPTGADVQNCGACNHSCVADNSSAACVDGSCVFTCAAHFGDCNQNDSDGCETSLLDDDANCGACGTVCNPQNASGGGCQDGACTYTSCYAGFDDCDGKSGNGCEQSLNDVNHCGACGTVCPGQGVDGTNASCSSRTCQLSCVGNHYDADGDMENGCETLDSDGNYSQDAATNLGQWGCSNMDTQTFTGHIISDGRTHSPTPTGFNAFGSVPDYWKVKATGGTCSLDYSVAITMRPVAGTPSTRQCYRLSFTTNKGTRTGDNNGNQTTTITNPDSDTYSSNTMIYFKIEKICDLAYPADIEYTVAFHL